MKRQDLIDALTRHMDSYIGIAELDGPNRSPQIDSFNVFMKVPMGSPYCLSGLWYVLDNIAKIYGAYEIDLPKTGHCLTFARRVRPAYKVKEPAPGDWGIYQMGESAQGHAVYVKRRLSPLHMLTVEFNTKPDDSYFERDGDGCYPRERPIMGLGNMKLITFVRVIDALRFPPGFFK